jgi:hypothetical protein
MHDEGHVAEERGTYKSEGRGDTHVDHKLLLQVRCK